jgi:hypothetical protein
MQVISMTDEYKEFVNKMAPLQTIGGLSNLDSNDLDKSSRLGFQYTGIYGELAWHLFRRGNFILLQEMLEEKHRTLRPKRKGDDGRDDEITFRGITRKVDIKTSHITDEEQIPRLNLVIPDREYHEMMIYVAAFTIGSDKNDRLNVDKVVLAGWCPNEQVKDRWKYDDKKRAVKVPNLRNLASLKTIFDSESMVKVAE